MNVTIEPTIPAPNRGSHPPRRSTPPRGACDAHCHVFGPAGRFPFAPGRVYTPPDSGLAELRDLQARLLLDRAVLVQASCHGTDNRALLDALMRGQGRYAGVVMIDRDHTDTELEEMHRLGVRGIRFNFVEHLGGKPDLGLFDHLISRIVPLGWHVDLHFDAPDLADHLDLLQSLPVPYVIDHMARIRAGEGIEQPDFSHLVSLLASDSKAWVKISGAERISVSGLPPYDDVIPFARALIDVAPDRVLWGTDWPHPNVRHIPDDGDLVDLLVDFSPDEKVRNRILVDNPTDLYGFV